MGEGTRDQKLREKDIVELKPPDENTLYDKKTLFNVGRLKKKKELFIVDMRGKTRLLSKTKVVPTVIRYCEGGTKELKKDLSKCLKRKR